jgi:hypothetical protein
MKNLITIVLLSFSLFAHGQNERAQKEAVRSQAVAPRQQAQSTPSREYFQKQEVRSSNQRSDNWNSPRNNPRRNFGWNDPYYRRWNMWGAPLFGFDYWTPGFYYDSWGYRNPYRVYHYSGGKADTIKGKPTRVSFGIQGSKNMAGAWLTIGNKGYFIVDYSQFIQNDESTFYPQLTMDKVIPWGDQKLENLQSGYNFYAGLGKKFGRTGLHAMVGFGREKEKYQFFDEMFVLSNNGKYSILASDQNRIGTKLGMIHDFKRATLKFDYDLTRKRLFAGIGINL